MTDRRRIAYHESAHCVVAWRLGSDVYTVTTEGHQHFGGLTVHAPYTEVTDDDVDGVGQPIPLLPDRLRRWAERRAVIALAGQHGEHLHLATAPTHDPAPPSTARPATPITTTERRSWREADSPQLQTDEATAWEYLTLAGPADPEVIGAWVRLADAQARSIVTTYAGKVAAVADALLTHRSLTGTDVTAILENTHANQDPQA